MMDGMIVIKKSRTYRLKDGDYGLCLTFDVLPCITFGNEKNSAYVILSWLFWNVSITWLKQTYIEYDIQGRMKRYRKGFRYYLSLGLFTK